MRGVIALVVTAMLAATASAALAASPAAQGPDSLTRSRAATQELGACVSAVYNSPGYAPIRAHIPLNVFSATIPQLTDARFPSNEDVRILRAEFPKLEKCKEVFLRQLDRVAPGLVPVDAATLIKSHDALMQLVNRNLSWGDYIRQKRRRGVKLRDRLVALNRKIGAGPDRGSAAWRAQRQAAASALARYEQTVKKMLAGF